MTDLGSSRPDLDTSRVAYGNKPDPTGWTGWVIFASCMMFLLGAFQALQGLVALFDDGFYLVTARNLVVDVNYNVWGTVHLILGVLLLLSGAGVLTGNLAARMVGISLLEHHHHHRRRPRDLRAHGPRPGTQGLRLTSSTRCSRRRLLSGS